MTWSNVPGGPPAPSPTDQQRAAAWERGGTTLFPAGRVADRVSTVLLLAFGAVMTLAAAVVGVIAVVAATSACDAASGCTPGGFLGGAAIAVGGSFVVGVLTVVLAVRAWLRRRTSWWIAAVGFVLAVGCLAWGGVVFTQAADTSGTSSSVGSA